MKQCEEIQKKANWVLVVLQCNIHSAPTMIKEHAYFALVRLITEYSSTAWSPYTSKGIASIEAVQRQAARFVSNDYQRSTSVSSLIIDLGWHTLHERRIMFDLALFYKIQNNLVDLKFPKDMTLNKSSTKKIHSETYELLAARIDSS